MKIALVVAPLALALTVATVPALGAADAASEAEAAKPYGIYTVRLAPKDPNVPAGVWRLTLQPGHYTHFPSSTGVSSSGRLSVSGNVLTLSRETLCPDAVARYRWSLSDGRLRLRVIGKDTCSGNDRSVMLTSKPWTAEAAKPYGTYTVRLNPTDPDVPAGVWSLTLRPGRHTLLSHANPIPTNSGGLSVSGNVLTFSREMLCPSAVGRYRWSLFDGRLRLRVIGKDPCSGNDRTVVLTSKPWTKRP